MGNAKDRFVRPPDGGLLPFKSDVRLRRRHEQANREEE